MPKNLWISATLAAILLVIILLLGSGSPFTNLQNSTKTSTNSSYKPFRAGFFKSEVPTSWSVTSRSENYLKKPNDKWYSMWPTNAIASIGKDFVSFDDLNGTQIDFYAAEDDIVENLIPKDGSLDKLGVWSNEKVGGKEARVFTANLDNGEVTKSGTGGKIYYFRLPESPIKTFVIFKQALGDENFEKEFKHLLDSATFDF